jgi:putative tricarboxylic transport membrane protein
VDRVQARWDVGVGAAVIAVAAAFIRDGAKLAPGVFEPIGPAPVPVAVAWGIIALAAAMVARAAWRLARGEAPAPDPLPYAPQPLAAAAVMAATALYVASMGLGFVGFAPATAVYLAATIWFLAEFRRDVLPVAAVIALILGFGLRYLFTRVLVTDLP